MTRTCSSGSASSWRPSTWPTTGLPDRRLDPDPLRRLASTLNEAHAGSRPSWVRVFGPLEDPRRIEWDPDQGALIGYLAPPGCTAVGIVAPGSAQTVDRRATRVQVTVVVDRHGGVAGILASANGEVLDEPPGGGRLLDALQRSLGLATAPPPWPPEQLVAVLWLDELAAVAPTHPLSWSDIVALCGVPDATASRAADATTPSAVVSDWERSWEALRHEAEHGGPLADLLPPDSAAWMDAGMFARWTLDNWPTIDELLVLVEPRLTTTARHRLRRQLTDLGAQFSG